MKKRRVSIFLLPGRDVPKFFLAALMLRKNMFSEHLRANNIADRYTAALAD
jgi:hypothetical protein